MNQDLVELTSTIVLELISNKEALSVRTYDNSDDKVNIEIMVDKADLPHVIGVGGKTINSIRTLVQASATLNGGRIIHINVDSY